MVSSIKTKVDEDGYELNPISLVGWIIAIIVISTLVFGSFFIVQPGEEALVFSKISGLKATTYGEGLHFKIPILDSPIKMNLRVQKQEEAASSASSDLQDVKTTVAVNFKIDPTQLREIYRTIGQSTVEQDYMQTQIMNPIIHESVKSVTAKHTAEELITQRSVVKDEIDKIIAERMSKYGIEVIDVSITDFSFSQVFTQAIEAKVVSLQTALKEENNLKVIEFQAKQQIESSRGQAESIRIINEQLLKSPQYIQYLAVQKWNGIMPLAVGGTMPLINLPMQNNYTGGI